MEHLKKEGLPETVGMLDLPDAKVKVGEGWVPVSGLHLYARACAMLAELRADERMYYPIADIETNAPLALIQCVQAEKINLLENLLAQPMSTFPLKNG